MRARALGLLASVLLVSSPARAQGGFPEWNGRAVQDEAGILTTTQEDSLRTLLAPARSRGVDVRVVTIRSMANYPVQATSIDTFAHGLFDAWRVGDRPERDGVLLLVATEDRQMRIQLGDGLPAALDGEARQVVADSIVPYFREGMRPRGILRGTAAIAEWFTPEWAARHASTPVAAQPAYTPPPSYSPSSGGAGDAASVAYILFGIGALVAALLAYQSYARNRPRDCQQCGARMTRLDEASDDVYLDEGQKLEEFLHSVDYDVWKCGSCGNHQLLPYQALFSGKSACPSCRYRTVATTTTVLEHATYDYGGREEVTRDCRNCAFHDSRIVHTPPRTRPSDSSSSSSGGLSSSHSFSSSSSSSSSSSGGGGFSSGRGASGSW
jgi:uncharacterized protein